MDGGVYLRRYCRRGHGEVTSLYEEDLSALGVPPAVANRRPGRSSPTGRATTRRSRWATPDGLGDLQTQHSCVLLLDVTENCNLNCPTCFAAAGPGISRFARLPDLMRTLDASIVREGGRIDVLMLSGGEPTVHPEILEIIEAATEREVTRVILNTNGIRIARDDRFLAGLARLRGRVEIYLQFDGFELESHLYHRGEDLRAVKNEAIRRLADARIFTTLAVAVAQDVNDREVGAIVDYALATDYVAGVAFQPVFGSGRANPIDPLRRATTTGTLLRLGEQTGGRLGPDDFIALPCSHPDCCAITYFIQRRRRRLAVGPAPAGAGQAQGVSRARLEPDRTRRRAVDRARRDDVRDDPDLAARADRLRPSDLRGVRPGRHGVRQDASEPGSSIGHGGRGAGQARQARLRQGVHGRVDAQRRAAAAVLRPRRLDRRR